LPKSSAKRLDFALTMEVLPVETLREALALLF
jgi:hypothetical protein